MLACSLTLALMPVAGAARADDAQHHGDRTFRILELGGRKVRWTMPVGGLPAKITYAFLTEPAQFPGARNCDAMLPPEAALKDSQINSADFRREVRAAFSAWEGAANIVFEETSSVAEAGILIGADAKARGRAFTNVALRNENDTGRGPGAIGKSLICLNPKQPWKIGFDGDLNVYDVRFTVTHEIGHAIGLDHPSPEGQLMSFRYVEKARGLQPGDIEGVVALYGRKGAGSAPDLDGAPQHAAASPVPAPAKDGAFGLGDEPSATPR